MSVSDISNQILDDLRKLEENLPLSRSCFELPSTKKKLANDLARYLFPIITHKNGTDREINSWYKGLKSKLKKIYTEQAEARRTTKNYGSCKMTPYHKARSSKIDYEQMKLAPLSEQITRPSAMPVEIAPIEELRPFYDRLMQNSEAIGIKSDSIGSYEQYKRGAYYTDGRIDLCKQVVGPPHIAELMQSFRNNPYVEHFLLGNNIIGPTGAREIASFIRNGSRIKTWYLAGNEFDAAGMADIADALKNSTSCTQLWLKRNPIMTEGAKAIAEMLKHNKHIEVLDLDNTGIMDEGAIAIFEALKYNNSIKSIYLDANGLTEKTSHVIADYFKHKNTLERLSISINRLGDSVSLFQNTSLKSLVIGGNRIELSGLKSILQYAARSNLQVLDVGYYKSTADMGELPNSFGDEGAVEIAKFIELNTPLEYLSFHNSHITDLTIIEKAMEKNTNLIYVTAEQYNISSKKITERCLVNYQAKLDSQAKFDKGTYSEYVRKLKHGPDIWVIDSIYRNNM